MSRASAAVLFEQRILHAFNKLDDSDTRSAGLADLEDAVRKAEPAALQHLLKLFSDANIDRRKPAGRAALMRFISLIATKHSDMLHSSFKRLSRLAFVRLKDSESVVRDDAAIALATCTLHLALHHEVATSDALGLIAHLIDRLCISIADASLALAKSSASALLELIQAVGASPRVPPRTWLVAWPQVKSALESPSGHAPKAELLACAAAMIKLLGSHVRPVLAEMLASILTEMQNSDWTTRKAAVEAAATMGASLQPFGLLQSVRDEILTALQALKHDKVSSVRAAVPAALAIFDENGTYSAPYSSTPGTTTSSLKHTNALATPKTRQASTPGHGQRLYQQPQDQPPPHNTVNVSYSTDARVRAASAPRSRRPSDAFQGVAHDVVMTNNGMNNGDVPAMRNVRVNQWQPKTATQEMPSNVMGGVRIKSVPDNEAAARSSAQNENMAFVKSTSQNGQNSQTIAPAQSTNQAHSEIDRSVFGNEFVIDDESLQVEDDTLAYQLHTEKPNVPSGSLLAAANLSQPTTSQSTVPQPPVRTRPAPFALAADMFEAEHRPIDSVPAVRRGPPTSAPAPFGDADDDEHSVFAAPAQPSMTAQPHMWPVLRHAQHSRQHFPIARTRQGNDAFEKEDEPTDAAEFSSGVQSVPTFRVARPSQAAPRVTARSSLVAVEPAPLVDDSKPTQTASNDEPDEATVRSSELQAAQLRQLMTQQQQMVTQMAALQKTVQHGFAKFDARLSVVEQRLMDVITRQSSLESDVIALRRHHHEHAQLPHHLPTSQYQAPMQQSNYQDSRNNRPLSARGGIPQPMLSQFDKRLPLSSMTHTHGDRGESESFQSDKMPRRTPMMHQPSPRLPPSAATSKPVGGPAQPLPAAESEYESDQSDEPPPKPTAKHSKRDKSSPAKAADADAEVPASKARPTSAKPSKSTESPQKESTSTAPPPGWNNTAHMSYPNGMTGFMDPRFGMQPYMPSPYMPYPHPVYPPPYPYPYPVNAMPQPPQSGAPAVQSTAPAPAPAAPIPPATAPAPAPVPTQAAAAESTTQNPAAQLYANKPAETSTAAQVEPAVPSVAVPAPSDKPASNPPSARSKRDSVIANIQAVQQQQQQQRATAAVEPVSDAAPAEEDDPDLWPAVEKHLRAGDASAAVAVVIENDSLRTLRQLITRAKAARILPRLSGGELFALSARLADLLSPSADASIRRPLSSPPEAPLEQERCVASVCSAALGWLAWLLDWHLKEVDAHKAVLTAGDAAGAGTEAFAIAAAARSGPPPGLRASAVESLFMSMHSRSEQGVGEDIKAVWMKVTRRLAKIYQSSSTEAT